MPQDELPDAARRLAQVPAAVVRRDADTTETIRANRAWWDREAVDYQREHGEFLGDADFLWCPEGLFEAEAGLLGDVTGRTVLEVGCGAGQCGRWLMRQGARVLGIDVSRSQLLHARELDERCGVHLPVALGDAQHLPIATGTVDIACSAYGAVPFVADSVAVMREVARVLRPGGRWVFSVTHPVRWCFSDDSGAEGLVVRDSYFDRRPYVEEDRAGAAIYAEHHRTIGDRVRELVSAGLVLVDIVEPEWPDGHELDWGGWSALRGRLIPGTAIFVSQKPA